MFPNPSFQAYAQGQGTTPTAFFVVQQRDPTPNDVFYPIGEFWINQTGVKLFYLNKQNNIPSASNPIGALQSVWQQISISSALATLSDTGNTPVSPTSSSAMPNPNNIQLIGTGSVTVTANPLTNSLTINGSAGGMNTVAGNDGVIVGPNGGGTINLVGGTTIRSTGNAGTFTETFDVVTTNHALLVGRGATTAAVPLAVGATNTVLLGNSGADPSFGQVPNGALVNSSINLNNGTNISVTGSPVSLGGTATINVAGPITPTTYTLNGVLYGNLTSALQVTAAGTTGQVLTATTGSAPTWQNPSFSGLTWSDQSGAFASAKGNGYFITNTASTTLPASGSSAEGDTIAFIVDTTNLLTITANAGQQIRIATHLSAVAGTAVNTQRGDGLTLVFRSTSATWFAYNSPTGGWNVT